MMSYIDLNWDFSQFDRDNSARFHGAGYAELANRIARDILRDRDAKKAAGNLAEADRELGAAQDAVAAHDYNGMLRHAERAYIEIREGAARAGVLVRVRQPSTWSVLPPAAGQSASRLKPSLIDLGGRHIAKRMR